MSAKQPELESLVARKYRHGFVTDIASDTVAPGLDEDVIRLISAKKNEPAFMLDWRLKAYSRWTRMQEPAWAHVHYPPIDFQAISYYSAPKQREDGPKSLADVDPKLLETYDKLGIPAARAREARRRRRGCGIRQRLGSDHVQGAPHRGGRDLLPVLRGRAQAS